jgi:hypothetical protein
VSPLPSREVDRQWNTPYVFLRESTIRNLWYFHVFGTTSGVRHCNKFLISWVNTSSLWLDREYTIYVDDIHQLKGLYMDGEHVTNGFQGLGKNNRKKGEINLYDKFNTRKGVCEGFIEPIILE